MQMCDISAVQHKAALSGLPSVDKWRREKSSPWKAYRKARLQVLLAGTNEHVHASFFPAFSHDTLQIIMSMISRATHLECDPKEILQHTVILRVHKIKDACQATQMHRSLGLAKPETSSPSGSRFLTMIRAEHYYTSHRERNEI